jgi:hypothetical protein
MYVGRQIGRKDRSECPRDNWMIVIPSIRDTTWITMELVVYLKSVAMKLFIYSSAQICN